MPDRSIDRAAREAREARAARAAEGPITPGVASTAAVPRSAALGAPRIVWHEIAAGLVCLWSLDLALAQVSMAPSAVLFILELRIELRRAADEC
eukprot:SAG31_NODE_2555_length_5496_cov_13.099314_6_plen_94_part_00